MASEVPCMLRKNINTVGMLTGDALLRHFRKGMYHGGDRWLHTFILCILAYAHHMHYTSRIKYWWGLNLADFPENCKTAKLKTKPVR